MNVIEAIKVRRSVRNFNGKPLPKDMRDKMLKAVEAASSPFGGHVSIRLKEFDLKGDYKPSTDGMIKGAVDFFLVALKHDDESALTAGYMFEQVVLRGTELGLGFCWIAATFKGTDFDAGQVWPDGEQLTVICPVGVPAKKSIMEKVTRFTLGSDKRNPFGSMFFEESFDKPASADGRFGEALQMLRLAPSSTNSQPWRALVTGDSVHFYYKPKSAASVLDCGIGLCHFHETELFYGRKGEFFKSGDAPAPPSDLRYLMSYRAYHAE
ncbi:MAG: hypothetical protein K2K92_08565 [Duncaniella sp.]|nr:hypothetical protein [Duncaniella sp.]